MKGRLFAVLLAALLLTGCGSGENSTTITEPELPPAEETDGEDRWSETIHLTTEWEEYDPSVETIWFMIENQGGEGLETGVDYQLETLTENGSWQRIPFRQNVGWNAVGMLVRGGGKLALSCDLSVFYHDFSGGGTYRIVKTVGGEVCAGQFKLVEGAAISAETPYGYAALETLPEDYSPIQRNAGGPDGIDLEAGVIFDGQGAYSVERVEAFLEKTRMGIPCQLRTIQDYGEGAVMVIDVIHENDHFLWRMWQGGTVTEQRFSYIVTDGAALYLSNGVDWENTLSYDSNKAFLVPEGQCTDLIPAVEQEMTDRLELNITRYKIWSEDGFWCAGTSDSEYRTPTEFFVTWQEPGKGSRGSTYDLQSWDGLETAITAMKWQEDGALKLTCETLEGATSALYFDPEMETLKNA